MSHIDYMNDKKFLSELDKEILKEKYVRISILDQNENYIKTIEGQTSDGSSINHSKDSPIRKNGSLSFLVNNKENDFSGIQNFLRKYTKIIIEIGLKNDLNENYDSIIWYKKGMFVITGATINNSSDGVNINLSLSDKMCLLNGDMGGILPCSITFDSYDQIQEDGTVKSIKQKFFDIIQSLMIYYANENIDNIIINDIPLQIKNIMRYEGSNTLYYNHMTHVFTFEEKDTLIDEGNWSTFSSGENVGYCYTDFTFPGDLITGIGDTVTSVLDKIIEKLGNYEYFYNDDGKFIFQEKKNYLNTSYQVTTIKDNNNNLSVLNNNNYQVDFSSVQKSVYNFDNENNLLIDCSKAPQLTNIKNDFHIWGKQDSNNSKNSIAIHYHVAIKNKPTIYNIYKVVYIEDGKIRLASTSDLEEKIKYYIPSDWRAELYLQGLTDKMQNKRPDLYKQELLDNFDLIYNFQTKNFKVDLLKHPGDLSYFIDYIDPVNELAKYSVDVIGMRTETKQDDNVNSIYELEVPNVILLDINSQNYINQVEECARKGQPFSNVSSEIYSTFALGSVINTAQDLIRDMIYQYTDYNETINISSIPIHSLDVNQRITVNDLDSGIHGDYIIDSITEPLSNSGIMSISASKALERI